MANHWAIAIGINQYQFLQPLRYAQQDAQALHDFLIEEAGFAPEQCLLLTDTSPPRAGRPTEPTRASIQEWIDEVCQQRLQPGDLLWCFFSGYGVAYEQQDYLMPIDGDPQDIPATAISARSLLEKIAEIGAQTTLVLLDMNRSQGLQAEAAVGVDTIDVASKLGIATVLACEPGEFSYEVSALHHGCFTATLLEGLRYGKGDTLAGLANYLRDRLPELTEHYWQPSQHPVTVVQTPTQLQQGILPHALGMTAASVGAFRDQNHFTEDSTFEQPSANAPNLERSPHQALANLTSSPTVTPRTTGQQPSQPQPNSDAATSEAAEPEMEDAVFWRRLLTWGGALVVVLLAGVVIRNLDAFTGRSNPSTVMVGANGAQNTPSPKPATPTPATNTNSPAPTATTAPATGPSGNDNTTATSPSSTTSPAASPPLTAEARANQELLDQARVTIRPSQASRFNQAIAQVSKIQPGEPLYAEAQQDIERWSRVILDLAEGRAQQGQFAEAITTARLVPQNNAQVYAEAQQAIAQWQQKTQQQKANQALITEAQNLLRRGEASSYNRAINLVRRIPADQPGYQTAQQRIAEWSEIIFGMAQLRASRGNLPSAIQTAKLVPPNTPAYAQAQKAIATWSR